MVIHPHPINHGMKRPLKPKGKPYLTSSNYQESREELSVTSLLSSQRVALGRARPGRFTDYGTRPVHDRVGSTRSTGPYWV
uniref:Putative ovule protein n=1 Tax=Solanum chacoense TaxID=4108 RepID=A0A0V0GWK2_SOLCH